MKKSYLISALVLGTSISGFALAQEVHNWRSASGEVWKSASGECWRDASWTPATAAVGCDGAIANKPMTPAPVPASTPAKAAPMAEPAPAPAAAKATPAAPAKFTLAANGIFDSNKSILKAPGKAKLNELITKIKLMNPHYIIAIGYTDASGSDAANLKLSLRRAEAVKAYLVSKGIDKNRIATEGRGKSNPIADNKTKEGRAQNRRVEIEVMESKTAN